MARKRKREEQPPKSNRGRPDARGVFVIFERKDEDEPERRERPEDAPLRRGEGE